MPRGIYKRTIQHRKNISKSSKSGTLEVRIKISDSLKGRELSLDHRKKLSLAKQGNKCYCWKGGITSLYCMIRRSIKYKEWRKQVFKRQNYTCQECFERGGDLEAHHIKRFGILYLKFLKLYNMFSPMEDKETLLKFAMVYEPFWEVKNGKTLCENCHRFIKHTDNININRL